MEKEPRGRARKKEPKDEAEKAVPTRLRRLPWSGRFCLVLFSLGQRGACDPRTIQAPGRGHDGSGGGGSHGVSRGKETYSSPGNLGKQSNGIRFPMVCLETGKSRDQGWVR